MSRPSDCWECETRFMSDEDLKSKVLHFSHKYGEGMAEAELNEQYGEWHEGGHEGNDE